MPSLHRLHDSYPRALYTHCAVCFSPLTQPDRGRTRLTCSPSCRQKLYRQRLAIEFADTRRWDADHRRAEAGLARLERRFGDFDPDTRWYIRYYLSRGIPLYPCRECGRPIIHSGSRRRFCSPSCRYRAHRRYHVLQDMLYRRGSPIDPRVIDLHWRGKSFPVCAHCGEPFVPHTGPGRPPRYCSKSCRQSAVWRRTHPAIIRRAACPGCGSRFAVRHPLQKYCTRDCGRRAARRARYAPHARTHPQSRCIMCGVRLPPSTRRRGGSHRQYCSLRCRLAAFRQRNKQRAEAALGRQKRRCQWCGHDLGWQAHGLRRYCSDRCANRARSARRRKS